jgi:hypothetical protein
MPATADLLLTLLLLSPVGAPAEALTGDSSLVAALADEDPDIRALAAYVLAGEDETVEPDAGPALVERLLDGGESWRVRAAAADALTRQAANDGRATDALVAVLLNDQDDWRVRAASVHALHARDDGRTLSLALRDRAEALEISNGRSVVSLTEPLSDARVLDALADPDRRMRTLARAALDVGTRLEVPDGLNGSAAGVMLAADERACLSEVLRQLLGPACASGAITIY